MSSLSTHPYCILIFLPPFFMPSFYPFTLFQLNHDYQKYPNKKQKGRVEEKPTNIWKQNKLRKRSKAYAKMYVCIVSFVYSTNFGKPSIIP